MVRHKQAFTLIIEADYMISEIGIYNMLMAQKAIRSVDVKACNNPFVRMEWYEVNSGWKEMKAEPTPSIKDVMGRIEDLEAHASEQTKINADCTKWISDLIKHFKARKEWLDI